MAYEIVARTLDKHDVAAVKFRARVEALPQHMGAAFGAAMDYLIRNGIQPEGPAVSHYLPAGGGTFAAGEFDVAAGFLVAGPIDGDGHVMPVELPAGEVAVTEHVGPYEGLHEAYVALEAWIKSQGREPLEEMW
jgi:effector-binding domain-containing protein